MPKLIWEQVYDSILTDILARAPGETLPSEVLYASRLQVSRSTVRKAVDEFVREGRVRRLAGKGLMVDDPRGGKARANLLISCACLPGDGDNFKTLMGCIDEAERTHVRYKTLNYTDPEKRYADLLGMDLRAYDGVILTLYESDADQKTKALLQRAGIPTVVVCNESDAFAFFDFDSFNSGYLMGEYLAQRGHRRILYIGTDRPIVPARKIRDGFRMALLDHGVTPTADLFVEVPDPGTPVYAGMSDQRAMPDGLERVLDRPGGITAVTGHSAFPVYCFTKKMIQRGMRVPEDVSILSLGDDLYLPWLDMPLTGIELPKYEIGKLAVEAMAAYLCGSARRLESALVPVELVLRSSVVAV